MRTRQFLEDLIHGLAECRPAGNLDHGALRDAYLPVLQGLIKKERGRIASMHSSGTRGIPVVQEITDMTDGVLRALWAELSHFYPDDASSSAIFALGGYGRGELNPYSDIDLCLIYPEKWRPGRARDKCRLFENILYLLWDLGFAVGHSSRTITESVDIAATDLTVKTSLIESRFLDGNLDICHTFREALSHDIISKRADLFIRQKVTEQQERHRKYGGSVYLREPNIKEGEGGLRDFHTALWVATVRHKVGSLPALSEKGVISEKELKTFTHSLDFMLRLRNELHYQAGKRHDILGFDMQEKVAANFGYKGSAHHLPVEHFMRAYYNHARNFKLFSDMMISRSIGSAADGGRGIIREGRRYLFGDGKRLLGDGLIAVAGTVCVSEPAKPDFGAQPADFMRPFYHACRLGYRVSELTVSLIRSRLRGKEEGFRSSREAGRIFMQILANPERCAKTLNEMNESRFLSRYIPEFGALRSLVQHDLYHKYTVDHHTLLAITTLKGLWYNKYPKLEFLAEVLRELKQPELLNLAILLHDIGKSKGHGHAVKGAIIARDICERMGLSSLDSETVVFLVENHLAMAHLSQRRELSDRGVIRRFAEMVVNSDRLMMLYLLTYADLSAVGPNVWNDWKAVLLEDCYRRTASFLLGVIPDREYERINADAARMKVREIAAGSVSGDSLERFFQNLPDRYFLTVPVKRIPEHAALSDKAQREGLVVSLNADTELGFSEITICTYDAPGIFSKVAGVLSSRGLNIMGAQIFTRRDGILIDTFQFADPNALMTDGVTFSEMERDIHAVVSGKINVGKLLSRRHLMPSSARRDIPTRIEIDNEASDAFTVLEVYTWDRLGLLHTITSALYRAGVYINSAKIATELDQVVDIFYVTDIFRHKIVDEKKLLKIQNMVLDALG